MTSRNTVGDSDLSNVIAILAAKLPDAPLNLVEVPGLTTGYQVGLVWNDGVYDGASPVIDYQVSYKQAGSNSYTIFASNIIE